MSADLNHADAAAPVLPGHPAWMGYAGAAGLCAGAALLSVPLAREADVAGPVLVFLLAVVLTAARFGRGPALLAAGLSVLLINLLFVPPRFSLAVADPRFFFTFAVMLVVGLVVGQLTAGLKAQAHAARERERRVSSLYDISRELGGLLVVDQVAQVIERFVAVQRLGLASVWVVEPGGTLRAVAGESGTELLPLATWVAEQGLPAGRHSSHCPELPACLLPLRATMAVRGVLAVRRGPPADWSADERALLATCATLVAGTLERIHYLEVAQRTALEVEGERLRNALLSAISHDLRTPLASLVGLAESLRLTRPGPTPQQAEMAEAMAASARRMSAMVNNLLDMARLRAGAVTLNRQWQPLEEVVGTALAASSSLLAQHRVTVRLADDLPWVRIDAVLMERVLVNLLENAVKYTPPSSVIEIAGGLGAGQVELSVRDHGPGFPAGRWEDLFKQFERGDREGTTPGVGLGLALCRAIVNAHGGTLHAESAPEGGARVVLRFPWSSPPPSPPGDEAGDESLAEAGDRASGNHADSVADPATDAPTHPNRKGRTP